MILPTFTFSQLVSNIATAVQGSATALIDFSVGSVLRAIAEATSSVVLWLQAIILQLLTVTRAATSNGSDLDSWNADFAFTRLPAAASTGQATFGRFTATQQAVVPIGTTIQTSDGTQNFTVTIDTTNSAYNPTLKGYVLPVNTASVNVPVVDTVAGSSGNVQANTITVITTPIPGVDTVTNAAAFTNGIDPEEDPAFRVRFIAYLASLSKATDAAVEYAVTSVQQGLDYTLTENYAYDGTYQPGYFWVAVDDGTGYPSTTLVNEVASAIEAVRGATITFGVFPPEILTANVAMTVTTATGFIHAAVVAAVTKALTDFINALKLEVSLPYTQLSSIAYGVAGVANVTGITLNSATSDLAADSKHKILAGTIEVA